MPQKSQLTILIVPVPNAVGHANACIGTTRSLLARGHRVAIFLSHTFRGRYADQGFEEILFEITSGHDAPAKEGQSPGQNIAQHLMDSGFFEKQTPKEKFEKGVKLIQDHDEKITEFNGKLQKVIDELKPDLFVIDDIRLMPCIHYSGIPWIRNLSIQPLWGQDNPGLPPPCFGLPYANKSKHEEHRPLVKNLYFSESFNDFVEKLGYPRYPDDVMMPSSQCLDVYAYPEELNYPEMKTNNWFNLEVFNHHRSSPSKPLHELVPETFLNQTINNSSDKLVYLSLGSMGSIDVDLMQRLIKILSKTPHKYIVSKGPRHAEFELASNMWGDAYLPQVALLPHMDLVITHGGNNTTTETFAQGKPMIVFPLFFDQLDNAQRLHETGYGIRLDPYDFEEEELLEAIDKLLEDDVLKTKLTNVANRLSQVNHFDEFADRVEAMFA